MVSSFKLLWMLPFILISSCGKDDGLPIGEEGGPKIIFMTSGTHSPNFGIAGADTICQNDSQNPGGTFKAMIADSSTRRACATANCSGGISENINWVLKPTTTYVDLNGVEIFTTNSSAIFDFPMTNPLTTTEFLRVWTGLSNDWVMTGANCLDWTQDDNAFSAFAGSPDETSNSFITSAVQVCGFPARLYCVQQ